MPYELARQYSSTVVKPEGYGPYLFVLRWKRVDRPQDDPMLAVFTFFEDMEAYRSKIEANGHTVYPWDLGIDHMRRTAS